MELECSLSTWPNEHHILGGDFNAILCSSAKRDEVADF